MPKRADTTAPITIYKMVSLLRLAISVLTDGTRYIGNIHAKTVVNLMVIIVSGDALTAAMRSKSGVMPHKNAVAIAKSSPVFILYDSWPELKIPYRYRAQYFCSKTIRKPINWL